MVIGLSVERESIDVCDTAKPIAQANAYQSNSAIRDKVASRDRRKGEEGYIAKPEVLALAVTKAGRTKMVNQLSFIGEYAATIT